MRNFNIGDIVTPKENCVLYDEKNCLYKVCSDGESLKISTRDNRTTCWIPEHWNFHANPESPNNDFFELLECLSRQNTTDMWLKDSPSGKTIEKFKVGDKVKILTHNIFCWAGDEEVLLRQGDSTLLANNCLHQEYWQLVEPKQRTIEDVEVGNIILWDSEEYKVLGILGKLIFLSKHGQPNISGSSFTIEEAKEYGWKIKQPESEKKEWQQIFLEAGTRELGMDCSVLIKTVSDILSSK